MNLAEKLKKLESVAGTGYFADRLSCELLFVYRMSECLSLGFDEKIEAACDYARASLKNEGAITKTAVLEVEEMLSELSSHAKSYTAHCVAHAHIDMNWKWGYQETAAVTIETLRTILKLMREYPTLTFSQSQASVYKILEDHAPEMLDEIKARIKEGRWEVSASTWTECDKNMPIGESLTRQVLYTKRYLSKLLDIPAESLRLDFEPDTFGHNIDVPEVLAAADIDYYYHCRGNKGPDVYRWQARSGREVLVYREPKWYGCYLINFADYNNYPIYCQRVGGSDFREFMNVYGVGDHGGGPTRRDIERILDMSTWPLYPTFKFSTYREYFAVLEKFRDRFPVVKGEQNFIFTGCYTSESRIKLANRIAEERLYDSEVLSSAATLYCGRPSAAKSFEKAWENVLFSQFHDILPGSGVLETREYCLGGFQRTMAHANTNATLSMHAIADAIDTSSLPFDYSDRADTISESGGVGFGSDRRHTYGFSSAETGCGPTRVLHVFNTTRYDRRETVEVAVFDYDYDLENTEMLGPDGQSVRFEIIERDVKYERHFKHSVLFEADIPAFGYATYVFKQKDEVEKDRLLFFKEHSRNPRAHDFTDAPIVLENSKLRAEFDSLTMALTSLVDKESAREMVSPSRPAGVLCYAEESSTYSFIAWTVGRIMKRVVINEESAVRITEVKLGELLKEVSYEMSYGRSTYKVKVSLRGESDLLDFELNVTWNEIGTREAMPQLTFRMPVAYTSNAYRYDTAYGSIVREPLGHDVPAIRRMEILSGNDTEARHIMITTDCKYGYRGYGNEGSVTLLRSSFDPDPLPESGDFRMKIGVAVVNGDASAEKLAFCYAHSFPYITGNKHGGELRLSDKLFEVCGDGLTVSAVKCGEDGGLIVRLAETQGESGVARLKTGEKTPKKAFLADTNEKPLGEALKISGGAIEFAYEPYRIVTVLVEY